MADCLIGLAEDHFQTFGTVCPNSAQRASATTTFAQKKQKQMPRHAKKIRQINPDGSPRTFRLPGVLGPDLVYTPSAEELAAPNSARAQAAPGTHEKPSAAKTASTASSPQVPPLESGASEDARPAPQGMHAEARPGRQARRAKCLKGIPSRQARRAKCLKGIPCVAGCMMSERHNAPGFRPPGGKCLKDTLSNTNTAISKIPTQAAAAPASPKPNRQQSHLDIVGKNKKGHKDNKKVLVSLCTKKTSAVASSNRLHVPIRQPIMHYELCIMNYEL